MIYVTKEAKQELNRLLSNGEEAQGGSFRIVKKGRGKLDLITDNVKPDDEVVEYEGKVLLVAAPGLTSNRKRISLDAYTAADMHRVVISEEDVSKLSSTVTVNWISFQESACVHG